MSNAADLQEEDFQDAFDDLTSPLAAILAHQLERVKVNIVDRAGTQEPDEQEELRLLRIRATEIRAALEQLTEISADLEDPGKSPSVIDEDVQEPTRKAGIPTSKTNQPVSSKIAENFDDLGNADLTDLEDLEDLNPDSSKFALHRTRANNTGSETLKSNRRGSSKFPADLEDLRSDHRRSQPDDEDLNWNKGVFSPPKFLDKLPPFRPHKPVENGMSPERYMQQLERTFRSLGIHHRHWIGLLGRLIPFGDVSTMDWFERNVQSLAWDEAKTAIIRQYQTTDLFTQKSKDFQNLRRFSSETVKAFVTRASPLAEDLLAYNMPLVHLINTILGKLPEYIEEYYHGTRFAPRTIAEFVTWTINVSARRDLAAHSEDRTSAPKMSTRDRRPRILLRMTAVRSLNARRPPGPQPRRPRRSSSTRRTTRRTIQTSPVVTVRRRATTLPIAARQSTALARSATTTATPRISAVFPGIRRRASRPKVAKFLRPKMKPPIRNTPVLYLLWSQRPTRCATAFTPRFSLMTRRSWAWWTRAPQQHSFLLRSQRPLA